MKFDDYLEGHSGIYNLHRIDLLLSTVHGQYNYVCYFNHFLKMNEFNESGIQRKSSSQISSHPTID